MFDFNKFTNYSQEILSSANAIMSEYKNSEMQPEHIMLALVKDNGAAKDYLNELKLLNQNFLNRLLGKIKNYPTISSPQNPQQLFLSKDTYNLLELANDQAQEMKDEYISVESIILAMTKLE
ncbi:hypothetical protein IJF81_04170, partial [bacterium]|nr:hypothetical protein [bacterium]